MWGAQAHHSYLYVTAENTLDVNTPNVPSQTCCKAKKLAST